MRKKAAQATGPRAGVQLNHNSFLRTSTLYILVGMVALAPFVGLQETANRLVFSALALAVCGVWLIVQARSADQTGLGAPSIAGVVLLILYFTGIFRAGSINGAIYSFITWSSMFALFWAWSTLRPTPVEQELLFRAVVFSALGIGLWGLTTYVGIAPAGEALAGGRISVGFFYANATASILMVGFLLSLILGFSADDHTYWPRLYMGCAIILLPALLLTLSRGAWLVTLVIVPVLIYLQRHVFIRFVAYLAVIGLFGLLATFLITVMPSWIGLIGALALIASVAMFMNKYLRANSKVTVLALGAILVGLMGYVGYAVTGPNTYTLRVSVDNPRTQIITFEVSDAISGAYALNAGLTVEGPDTSATTINLWTIVEDKKGVRLFTNVYESGSHTISEDIEVPEKVSALQLEFISRGAGAKATLVEPRVDGGYSASFTSLPHRLLPYSVASRVGAMSGESLLNDGRFVFYGDGLELFKQAPLLGQGGGAWRALYGSVQRYYYAASHIHSDPFDVLLEIGLNGLLCLAVFWSTSLYNMFGSGDRLTQIGAIAALAVLLHSLGEALFAFPALYVVCFSLLGSGQQYKPRTLTYRGKYRAALVYSPILLILCAILATTLWLAELDYVAYARQGPTPAGLASLRGATAVNPWSVDYKLKLATELYGDYNTVYESLDILLAAHRLEPSNPLPLAMVGQWYAQSANYKEAMQYYRSALAEQPMNIKHYEDLARVASEAAISGDITSEERVAYAKEVISVVEAFSLQEEAIDDTLISRSIVPFRLSQSFHLAIGQAQVHLGLMPEAVQSFQAALKKAPENVRMMTSCWLHRIAMLGGETGAIPDSLEGILASETYSVYWRKVLAATER